MEKNFELMIYLYDEIEQITIYKLKKNNGKYKLYPEQKETVFTDSLIHFLNSDDPCSYLLNTFGLMAYKSTYESIYNKKMKIEFETKAEYNEYSEKVMNICREAIIETQMLFADYITKIYNHNKQGLYEISSKPIRTLLFLQDETSNIQAFQKYEKLLTTDISIDIENIKPRKLLSSIISKYYLYGNNLLVLFFAELTYFSRVAGEQISKCQYCGDFFNPQSRIDEKFCSKVYPDGSTCKSLGVRQNWKNVLHEDEVRKTYNNIYQKKLMYCKRNSDNQQATKEFEEWKIFAKDLMKKYKKGEVDREKAMEDLNK